MITKSNLKNMLKSAGFSDTSKDKYEKNYPLSDCSIIVDFRNEKILYPEDKGFKVNVATTTNFSEPENFVVLECVNRLLDKGYRPENIELERTWTLGHEQKSGRADICVSNQNGKTLFIVECKTFGVEYNKEMKNILSDGGQLISYWQQERGCRWLVLYASNINSSNDIEYTTDSIDCSDDENILNLARKDATILLYKDAHTTSELYDAWKETYEQRFSGDIIFRDDSVAYDIGVKPLRKKDLKDFSENDKIVNRFEEILRHNNVSDKENAFNRLIALFICKLVDEIQKTDNDIVEFQYKVGTDTYESLQDRLQRLHKEGMEQAIISEQSAKVKSKFVEMFGDNPATTHGKNSVKLSTLCENLDNERKPITEHLRNKGDIPYYGASGIVDYIAEYIFDETLLLISEDGANLVSRNMPIAFSITGKSWVNNHVHILRFKNYELQKYVESYINNMDLSEYINKNANPKLTQEKLNSIMIYMPNNATLDLYISSINQCDKLKFEAQERLEELNAAREDIIDKYFR